MPASPTLSTSVVSSSTGHISDTNAVHAIINKIYLAADTALTKTGAYTLVASDTGEIISINSSSSVTITVPSLPAGTSIELLRYGTGAVTLTASGVTLRAPVGSTAAPRVQYSSISLWWRTATEVIVGGDLT